jgi:hypothetical protein
MSSTTPSVSSNPFVAPPINTVKPFEPPQFEVIRDLLARKFIEMQMNPFGVAGAQARAESLLLRPRRTLPPYPCLEAPQRPYRPR